LNNTNLIPAAQSEALLQELEQQTAEECRTVIATAQREADTLVTRARSSARRRAHEVIEALRNEGIRRLARAKAKVETEARQRAQQCALEVIQRAWPLLAEALAERWRDPATRLVWTDGVARCGRDQLNAAAWIVEHSADWSDDEKRNFRNSHGAGGDAVTFVANSELAAGIKISADEATLDATSQGLLADRSAVAALLLAEIGQETTDGRSLKGHDRP
jgi:HPt (histidine-containing phosphotransfer) domain-containing protein